MARAPVGLTTCITAPLSHALACNAWSDVRVQPTPLVEIDASHGCGSLSANISGGRGQFLATPVGVERLEICRFVWCSRYVRRLFRFVTIHASGRRTDGRRDSNTVRCITHSCTVTRHMTKSIVTVAVFAGLHYVVLCLFHTDDTNKTKLSSCPVRVGSHGSVNYRHYSTLRCNQTLFILSKLTTFLTRQMRVVSATPS